MTVVKLRGTRELTYEEFVRWIRGEVLAEAIKGPTPFDTWVSWLLAHGHAYEYETGTGTVVVILP